MSNAVNTESAPPAKTDQLGHVEPKIEKHGHDVDEAMRAFEALQGETIELDEATNRRLLRTVDWHIMPIMCFVYGMNYLDKTALSYASVMGLEEDLSLHGNQYQWLGSLFYIGYLAWEYPTSRLLQWLPLGKYSAACIVIWGLVLACFAAVVNYPGAVAIRLFLGIFEAAVTPGFTLLTSQWYTKYEQYSRVNIWFSFNGVGQIVGGLVAYGIAVGSEKNGSAIAPWKVLFLVTGVLTMVLGLIFLVIVPDSQLNAWWLKKADRALAVARVRVNQQGIGNKHFKLYQVKEALLDPMTWAFFLYALVSDIPNGGLTNFFSQLIRNFGFTSQQSLLYGVPGGAVEVISLLASGYVGHITRECLMSSLGGQVAAIVGMVLIVALPLSDNTGRLIGYYMTQANATGFVALLSLISSNVAGYTKKTTVAALYLIGYCAGNIVGPQIFLPKDAPRYVPAEITIIVCWAVCCLLLVAIRFWYRRENKRKAVLRADPGYVRLEDQEWLDLTDRENLDFVYSL